MKISIKTADLLAQLQPIARVASTRTANNALSGVQIAASEAGAEMRATDMDISLRMPLAAQVEQPGMILLPGRLLLDVVRSLPKSDSMTLALRPENQDVEVSSGQAVFHLRTLRNEDFPTLPEPGGDTVVRMPAPAFLDTIQMVSRSASRDETRPVLTGVLVSASDDHLRMVATDSYRLSIKETKLGSPLEGGFEANVPARALDELRGLAASAEAETITIGMRANQVVFEVGDAVLASRLIDGQFPVYQQLVPDQFEHELRVSGEELREVVRRISLMAQKNTPLRLGFSEGQLTISAQTPDVGEASEPLPVPFAGEPFDIGFNPEFLRDGLESFGDGDLMLKMITPLRPGLLSSADDSGFQYLIMPIRLNV